MSGSEQNWPEARARLEALIKTRAGWAMPDGRHYEADDIRAALARIDALTRERDGAERYGDVEEKRADAAEARVRELEAACAEKDAALRSARDALRMICVDADQSAPGACEAWAGAQDHIARALALGGGR